MDINARLRAWREKSGLTLEQAGERVGVSAPTWLDYEKGRKRPSVARRPLLEAVTGISAAAWESAAERKLAALVRAAQADAPQPPTDPPARRRKAPPASKARAARGAAAAAPGRNRAAALPERAAA